jgi:hypothetical protein
VGYEVSVVENKKNKNKNDNYFALPAHRSGEQRLLN